MGMFLTIEEAGAGGSVTLNITTDVIEFFINNTEIKFEILNQAIVWEVV